MKLCRNCTFENDESNANCVICRYPMDGTEKEKAHFISQQVMAKNDVVHAIQKVRIARIGLFVLSVLFALLTAYLVFDFEVQIFSTATFYLSLIFGVAAFISIRLPFAGMTMALGITILFYTLQILLDPMYILSGILWKIIILTMVLYGFSAVFTANRTLRKNPYIAEMLGYTSLGKASKPDLNPEILDQRT